MVVLQVYMWLCMAGGYNTLIRKVICGYIECYRWLYVNYMNACPIQLEPGKVFCADHCQGATSNSVPTSLKEFIKYSKVE